MVLFKKRITKALIRLRGCAGWSAPVLFATPRRQVFSRRGPNSAVLVALLNPYILNNNKFTLLVGSLELLQKNKSFISVLIARKE